MKAEMKMGSIVGIKMPQNSKSYAELLVEAQGAVDACMDRLQKLLDKSPLDTQLLCELTLELTDSADFASDFGDLWTDARKQRARSLLKEAAASAVESQYEFRIAERSDDFETGLANAEALRGAFASLTGTYVAHPK